MIRLALTFVCWALMIGVVYPQPDVASTETSSPQSGTAAKPVPADAAVAPAVVAPVQSPVAANPAGSQATAPGEAAGVEKPATPSVSGSTVRPAAKVDKKPKPAVAGKTSNRNLQLDHLYVVEGCEACNGLQAYLRRVGVKLSISRVGNSPYSTFPTVVYSDGTTDNGERVYSKTCQFPKSLAVDECRSGG